MRRTLVQACWTFCRYPPRDVLAAMPLLRFADRQAAAFQCPMRKHLRVVLGHEILACRWLRLIVAVMHMAKFMQKNVQTSFVVWIGRPQRMTAPIGDPGIGFANFPIPRRCDFIHPRQGRALILVRFSATAHDLGKRSHLLPAGSSQPERLRLGGLTRRVVPRPI